MQDEQIVDLFLQRSESAITELDQKYGKLLHQLAGRFLTSREDIEECVNDAYLGVWNTIPPNQPEHLTSYVCRIVRNLAVSRYHKNAAQKRRCFCDVSLEELGECLAAGNNVEEQMHARLLTEYLKQFLEKQSEENRVIFMRRYWFAEDYTSIAQQTGLSVKNVSVRLTRMRKQLKQYLENEGVL